MKPRRPLSIRPCRPRRGFTLIELLVVISIIATLMALILPAIQQARATARRTECLNNMRNIAIAFMAKSSTTGQLPAYGTFLDDGPTAGVLEAADSDMYSWVVDILAALDRRDLADGWNRSLGWANTTVPTSAGGGLSNAAMSNVSLKVLSCPDDVSAFQRPGGLSYVVNAGYAHLPSSPSTFVHNFNVGTGQINWSGGPNVQLDQDAERDTGVLWARLGSNNESHSIDTIWDGTGQTILLTENVNAGITSWADPDPRNCAFIYPIGSVNYRDPGRDTTNTPAWSSGSTSGGLINGAKSGNEGTPFPSSLHAGGVNVVFCDGSVRFVAETVDTNVYFRLVSAGGTRTHGSIPKQVPLGDNEF